MVDGTQHWEWHFRAQFEFGSSLKRLKYAEHVAREGLACAPRAAHQRSRMPFAGVG